MLNKTLDALIMHSRLAARKHRPIASHTEFLDLLDDRLSKVLSAARSTNDPDHLLNTGRRLLQLATIAIRAVEDLGLPQDTPRVPPPDPQGTATPPAEPAEPLPALPLDQAEPGEANAN